MTQVTRRYRFSASHRLHAPGSSEEENQRLYGKCNNPFGHGHDYVLDVSFRGTLDPQTGLIAPLSRVNALVSREILQRFSSRNLNLDVPEFASDFVPTTENVAAVILERLRQPWAESMGTVELCGIHVQETDRNGFTIFASGMLERTLNA